VARLHYWYLSATEYHAAVTNSGLSGDEWALRVSNALLHGGGGGEGP
jgi:hypothetical protein